MPREGTRSQTGNSRPRIFHAIGTGPTTTRRKPAAASSTSAAATFKSKFASFSSNSSSSKALAKKETGAGVVDRVKSAVGLAPREPKKVQKKGPLRRAVQKVKAVARVEDGGKK